MTSAIEQCRGPYFFSTIVGAERHILFLDYDQTISLFSRPQQEPSVPELLHAIMTARKTRVILISELRAVDVVSLLQMSPTPEIWGSCGLQRRDADGVCEIIDIPAEAREALTSVDLALEGEGLGELTEVEPGALVVRWNGMTRRVAEEIQERVHEAWLSIRSNWVVPREFEGGIQFRFPLWSKAEAIRHLLEEVQPEVPVAYLGDENSENVFRELTHRGFCVLIRSKFVATAADLWLQTPAEVIRFLSDWLQACTADG